MVCKKKIVFQILSFGKSIFGSIALCFFLFFKVLCYAALVRAQAEAGWEEKKTAAAAEHTHTDSSLESEQIISVDTKDLSEKSTQNVIPDITEHDVVVKACYRVDVSCFSAVFRVLDLFSRGNYLIFLCFVN